MATKHPATTIRLTDDDRTLIATLKQRLGVRSTTELIRMALRALENRERMRGKTGTKSGIETDTRQSDNADLPR